jgi:XTP/dITP diphosphohydrolase
VKLVLATRNRDKVREIVDLLAGLDVEVLTLDSFPDLPATVEDGDTLEANAVMKARATRDHTGLSALADDTGLEVDALGGAPGIYAARYARENAPYAENRARLLREMAGVPPGKRGALFRTVLALALSPADAARAGAHLARHPGTARPGPVDCLLAEGMLPGEIAAAERGAAGFGYDPLFVDAATGRTLAEMTLAEKNRTSHRYRALVEMREMLLRHGLAWPSG